MKTRILWIEGKRAEGPSFITTLRKKGFQVDIVTTGNEALSRLESAHHNLVVVYVASLRTSGKRICHLIHVEHPNLPIVVIAGPGQVIASDMEANVVLQLPFTARKLINRIMPLLPTIEELELEEQVLQVGDLRLSIDHQRLRLPGREVRLTPYLCRLLQVLMEHPGEVIERQQLFREVWKTEYTGDTRTLDVHISWLRRAIEDDPRKPVYLKTIRGVGYRLDP